MNKINLCAIAVGLAFCTGAMGQSMSKEEYKSQKDGIAAAYQTAKAACGSYAGNAKDVCIARAEGNENVAMAELDARNEPGNKTQFALHIAHAEADYAVARGKCNDLAGNPKDVCVKQAEAAQIASKADAKAQLKISDAGQAADLKATDARNAAAADKRDADFAVAKEKCDAYASDAKDRCITDAKARFGKS
jgi:hypothetical protein